MWLPSRWFPRNVDVRFCSVVPLTTESLFFTWPTSDIMKHIYIVNFSSKLIAALRHLKYF